MSQVSLPHEEEAATVQQALSRIEAMGDGQWEASVLALGRSHVAVVLRGPAEPRAHDPGWVAYPLPDGRTVEYFLKLPVPQGLRGITEEVLRAVRRLLDSRRHGKYRTRGH